MPPPNHFPCCTSWPGQTSCLIWYGGLGSLSPTAEKNREANSGPFLQHPEGELTLPSPRMQDEYRQLAQEDQADPISPCGPACPASPRSPRCALLMTTVVIHQALFCFLAFFPFLLHRQCIASSPTQPEFGPKSLTRGPWQTCLNFHPDVKNSTQNDKVCHDEATIGQRP